jgi:hypothetical protein
MDHTRQASRTFARMSSSSNILTTGTFAESTASASVNSRPAMSGMPSAGRSMPSSRGSPWPSRIGEMALVQLFAAAAERLVTALVGAGAEAVGRRGRRVHAELGHGRLLESWNILRTKISSLAVGVFMPIGRRWCTNQKPWFAAHAVGRSIRIGRSAGPAAARSSLTTPSFEGGRRNGLSSNT